MTSINEFTSEQLSAENAKNISNKKGEVIHYNNGNDDYYVRLYEREQPVFRYDNRGNKIGKDETSQNVGYAVLVNPDGEIKYRNGTVVSIESEVESYIDGKFNVENAKIRKFESQFGQASGWFGMEGTRGGWNPNDTEDLDNISLREAVEYHCGLIDGIKELL